MTAYEDLKARRSRAVHRAMTRYVSAPSAEMLALIDWLRDLPPEAFLYDLVDVHSEVDAHGHADYSVDGVHATTRPEAVDLLQDRYGITRDEAETLMPDSEARRSTVTSIGGGR